MLTRRHHSIHAGGLSAALRSSQCTPARDRRSSVLQRIAIGGREDAHTESPDTSAQRTRATRTRDPRSPLATVAACHCAITTPGGIRRSDSRVAE